MANKRPLVLTDGRVAEVDPADTIVGGFGGVLREVVTSGVSVTVAPDIATQQPGDWPIVGAAGVLSAYDYLQSFSPANAGVILSVVCRAGTYVFTGTFAAGNSPVRIIADVANTAPTSVDPATLYVSPDPATRLAQMRSYWSVEFNFLTDTPERTRVSVGNASSVAFYDILFTFPLDATTVSGLYADAGGAILVSSCGVYGSGYGFRTQTGGTINIAEFVHCTSQSAAAIFAGGFSSIFLRSTAKDSILARCGNSCFVTSSNSLTEVRLGGGLTVYSRNVSNAGIYCDTSGRFFSNRALDVSGCSRGVQCISGGAAEIRSGVKVRGNSTYAVQLQASGTCRLEGIDVDPAGTATQRTVFVSDNSTLDLRGSTVDTIISPAEGTSGNNGGVVF